jgi:hypothetical protein
VAGATAALPTRVALALGAAGGRRVRVAWVGPGASAERCAATLVREVGRGAVVAAVPAAFARDGRVDGGRVEALRRAIARLAPCRCVWVGPAAAPPGRGTGCA